jgi:hypothetical protein
MRVEVLGPFAWLKSEGDHTPWLFDAPEARRCGVYLMTAATQAGWIIFWVGQTSRPFRERFATHSREFLAGTYNVLDATELQTGRRTVRWYGLWWRKGSPERYDEYLAQAGDVAVHTRALLRAARVFFIPLDPNKRILARIEAAIVNTLYADPNVGAILDKGYHLAPRWPTEPPAEIELIGTTFLGLPEVLEF